MALPEIQKAKATKILMKFCNDRVPPHIRDKVKLEIEFRGKTVTLIEVQPAWNDPRCHTRLPIAQFRFDVDAMKWNLYCSDRNSKWHVYTQIGPTSDFDLLIKEVDRDPTGIFWG